MAAFVTRAVHRIGLGGAARALLDLRGGARRRDRADNEHLRLLLAFTLGERSNCVDIGCNRGDVLEQIVRASPGGSHYAFEPLPELADQLSTRFPAVAVRAVALADREGTATFTHVLDNDACSGLSDRHFAEGHRLAHLTVPLSTLDDQLPADYRPDLLKIDVEGAEFRLLLGARRVLSQHRPVIWFEHGGDSLTHFGAASEELWDLLCVTHGYRLFDADGVGPLSREDFARCRGRIWTFLARPTG